jgi:hypothetical protein
MVDGKDWGKSGKRKQNLTTETGRGAMLKGGKRKAERGQATTDGHGSTRPFWFIFFTTSTRCAEVGRGWKKKLWKDINHLSITYGTGMADETNAEKWTGESGSFREGTERRGGETERRSMAQTTQAFGRYQPTGADKA